MSSFLDVSFCHVLRLANCKADGLAKQGAGRAPLGWLIFCHFLWGIMLLYPSLSFMLFVVIWFFFSLNGLTVVTD